ncbi:MAG TPA: hypothetical protein VJN93_08725 [Candidatus Acidoferrum sp.]|nr:hypothetical protein [Candidatus Acidoferrum sp.]
MAPRTSYAATNPQRVLDKVRECRYFLAEMSAHESAEETDRFWFSLSAFLKSFRSIAYRMYGVTETQTDRDQMKALERQLNAHPRIGFLIDSANLEVHGDGAVIWKRYNISIPESMQKHRPRLSPRFGDATRWKRLASPFEPVAVQTQMVVGTDWQFAGNSASLLELCHIALDEIKDLVIKSISLTQPIP